MRSRGSGITLKWAASAAPTGRNCVFMLECVAISGYDPVHRPGKRAITGK
ncbi:hypothetical protein LY39_00871 [Roseinatronobacter bogoriensis subsp. barguzinensis]|nr:hypothetical protein [Rhodobaca bogoriensis DSM 18756]TDW39843.1 hypothetical protein LY39_00871 [Rhodobaca barguzinensis]